MSTRDLLDAWRDASRAAELAERLASVALQAAQHADRDVMSTQELVRLAEEVAASAEHAAEAAREAARRAVADASSLRGESSTADEAVAGARAAEETARDDYHVAEDAARRKHGGDGAER